jgi:hypothetical protein
MTCLLVALLILNHHNYKGVDFQTLVPRYIGLLKCLFLELGIMVFDATFSDISVIPWPSVLLVEETGENHRPVPSH